MPSGRIHETVNLLVLVPTVYWLPEPLTKLPFIAGYLVGTFWVTPDLDLAKSRASHRWGVLRWVWLPYAWLFPHRGLSHRLLLGALTRVLYLAALAGLGLWCLDYWGYCWRLNFSFSRSWLSFFAGLLVADGIHLLLDTLCTRR